jgi:glycosyltransferase involved in cell wall biosynthesis
LSSPLVHFAIPIRNVEPWLDEALGSLHAQTEPRWTATMVDDDSSDNTAAIAADWAARDPRMRLIQRGRLGLAAGPNLAISQRGEAPFIARFDGDDVCSPDRVEKQLAFFSANPDVDILDSRFALNEEAEESAGGMVRYRNWHDSIESHRDFAGEFLVENPICHPASMFRSEVLQRLDKPDAPYRAGDFPEDYDLWLRLYRAGCRFHKLQERLVLWRDRPSRATRTDPAFRKEAFFGLKWDHLTKLLDIASERIVVWGAKKGGKPWIRALSEAGHPPVAVVDIDPAAIGNTRRGVPVIAPEGLRRIEADRVLIAVGAAGARTLIEAKLSQLGLPHLAVTGLA